MGFGTKGLDTESAGGGSGKYIYPGVYPDGVIVHDVTVKNSNNGNPMVDISFVTPEGLQESPPAVRSILTTFANNMDANKINAQKLTHLATKMIKRAPIDAIDINTGQGDVADAKAWANAFVTTIGPLIKGKLVRVKFSGEEYKNDAGEVKEAPRLPRFKFAEAIIDGAESPIVPKEQSELTYDKTNQYDLKKLANTAGDASAIPAAQGLPNASANDL